MKCRTSKTPEICDELEKKYSNITVIHQENRGLSEARNRGLKLAKGKYCLFVDSDDFIYKNSLKKLADYIESHPEDEVIVMRRMTFSAHDNCLMECKYFFDDDMLRNLSVSEQYRLLQELPDCWLGAWLFCCKLDYIREKKLSFYPGIFHEDEEWVPRVIFNTLKKGFCNYPVYCNRIERKGSITMTMNIKRVFDKLRIIDLLADEFEKEGYSNDVKKVILLRRQMLMCGILGDCWQYRQEDRYNELIDEISNRYSILRRSEKKLYTIIYYVCKVMGVNAVAAIISNFIQIEWR